ncbi:repressor protein [Candidatus Desantisbacteria bacterium CG1_02_38_46]|uniref:XRE family transcriptional regulator n=3 Tax=unclassified Candidatus Desantisiibacteriota TaxID=3106372 RepID=A0A2H9PBQ7_9BACT|nr:MAG: repressor protein [Candidatus Desantisbacteria bacterium CG1_02_38_46]PIU52174.1 MAG: XRE family transcriptional regulator [Candidatus Desantisbacteria bacterium CG07_land_8_20_14_0_80_39_15]PIZ15262.1 MAG: XRE family transcriptional regulator [Candidatus Desantisbacteria bacterium CG_4_10_14_0_8_um_filter_39_17]
MVKIGQRIKELRGKAGMSQQELADRLGVLRATVSQIENGERKVCEEELIKLSKIFEVSINNLLGLEKEPEIVLEDNKKANKEEKFIRINVPQKNLEKFKEVFLYILNKISAKPNIGETVIYKLLYFIDFNFYEKYEEQLIGATYIKNHFGPTPIEFKKIVEKMLDEEEITKIKSEFFKYPQTKYLPLRKPDLSRLKANEIEVIDDVLNRLSDMTAAQISEYSHNDVPWLTTEEGKKIEYESVFYRTPAYSVRAYNENI